MQCHEPTKFDTMAHHHHKEGTLGAQCINCHMATRMYMVIDERRDHSFRIPRPDLSKQLGTTNACNNCHTAANETNQWAADAIKKWYGEKTNLAAKEPGRTKEMHAKLVAWRKAIKAPMPAAREKK